MSLLGTQPVEVVETRHVGAEGEDSSSKPGLSSAGDTLSADSVAREGPLTYVALGDSWPEGDHCNPACRTFPAGHADALSELLGEPVLLYNLAGSAQPYFQTPDGGGSTGLLKASGRTTRSVMRSQAVTSS